MNYPTWFSASSDDIIFDGRNKAYGAFQLRMFYSRYMSRAMLIGTIFSLLIVNAPNISRLFSGYMPEAFNPTQDEVVILIPPPSIDPLRIPPPPLPSVEPPSLKSQIKFIPPTIVKDEAVIDEESLPPTIEKLATNVIGTETIKGEEDGIDASLIEVNFSEGGSHSDAEPIPDKPFTYVQQMPAFPGGDKAMYEYIYQRIKYPAIARENDISGRVILQFVVKADGSIQHVTVIAGIGGGCDEEAMRVVQSMPNWKPGKHNGKAVPVTFTLPIRFTLR